MIDSPKRAPHTTASVGSTVMATRGRNLVRNIERHAGRSIEWNEEVQACRTEYCAPRYLMVRHDGDAIARLLQQRVRALQRRAVPTVFSPDHQRVFEALRTGAQDAMAELRIGQHIDPGDGSTSGITWGIYDHIRTDRESPHCRIPRWQQVEAISPDEWQRLCLRPGAPSGAALEDFAPTMYSPSHELIYVRSDTTLEEFFLHGSHEIAHAMSMHIFGASRARGVGDAELENRGIGLSVDGLFLGMEEAATEILAKRIRLYAALDCKSVLPDAARLDQDESYAWHRGVLQILHQHLSVAAGLGGDVRPIEEMMLRSKLSGDFRYHGLLYAHFGSELFTQLALMDAGPGSALAMAGYLASRDIGRLE